MGNKPNGQCNYNSENDHQHEHEYIYLTLDDGAELKCAVLGVFEVDDQEYIALVPENEEIVFIYRYDEISGEPELSKIEDDEEFHLIAEAFNELFHDEEE